MKRRKKIARKSAKKNHTQERIKRIIIFVATLILLILLFFLWRERRYLYRFSGLGLLGLFVFNVLANATVFVPVPVFIAVFIGGAIWSPLLVGLVSGVGSAVGELVGFYLGYGGRGFVNNINSGKSRWISKIERWFGRSGFLTIFVAAALPDPFFDAVGILAGTLNYSVVKFFLATAAGRVVRNIIIAWSGAKIIP